MGRKKHPVPRLLRRRDGGYYVADPTRLTAAGKPSQVRLDGPADYERWKAEFLRQGRARPSPPRRGGCSVRALCDRYLIHAETYYRKAGRQTSQYRVMCMAVKFMLLAWEGRDVASLRAADMKALRQKMVNAKLARKTVNALCGKVRLVVRWGVEEGLASGETLGQLQAVRGLQKHRTEARETGKVPPVGVETLDAAAAHLKPRYRAMAYLQFYGAARPGEICALQLQWVDRSGPVWCYRVPDDFDKTSHRRAEGGPGRKVWFGPKAQAVLSPYFKHRPPDRNVFVSRTGRPLDTRDYNKAVGVACRKAGVPRFTPNQLRHGMATAVRARFGLDAAQAYLGHESANVSEIYAAVDEKLASQIAAEMG